MEAARPPPAEALERAAALLAGARPTARNLGWAVERVVAAALAAPDDLAGAAREAAVAIQREDEAASAALARHGADALEAVLPPGPVTVMTHCNSGALAASGRGTGLGVIAELAGRREVDVLACEARPLLQGARLTVWELRRLAIEHALLVDAAAPGLLRRGAALAASAAGVPFLAAGPSSSVDLRLPAGDEIEIEERDAAEVRAAGGALLTVEGTACRNPAFDVTPAELGWALVTERGAASPVNADTVARVA